MSRTVESIGDNVIFFDAAFDEYEWQDVICNLQDAIYTKYPSFAETDKFVPHPYRENRIILENMLASISISGYCGCGAISVFVCRDISYLIPDGFAERWLNQCFPGIKKIIRQYVTSLVKIGTFSNGEAVYRKEG